MGNRQHASSFDLSTLPTPSELDPNQFSPKRMRGLSVNDLQPPHHNDAADDHSFPPESSESFIRDANSEDFGWFEDFESPMSRMDGDGAHAQQHTQSLQLLHKALTLPTPVTQAPLYILESSLETQRLWYATAGRRPKQPEQERQYFERLWSQNFANSEVKYPTPLADITNITPPINEKIRKRIRPRSAESSGNQARLTFSESMTLSPDCSTKRQDIIPKSELRGEILYRGKSNFSNAVSKSFLHNNAISLTLYMPYFRVIKALNGNVHAEFMIVVTLGGNSPVTFGIWKRHSDFSQLALELSDFNIKSGSQNSFKNSLLSWQCVLQRKRWYKSLDKEYLTLKCFLLERFIQDVLFEADQPEVLTKFLELD